MLSLRKIIIFFIFLFCCFSVKGQIDASNFRQEIRQFSKKKTSKETRKKMRHFFRLMRSDKISSQQKQKVLYVLNNFQKRKLNFNPYYVSFFELLLEFKDDVSLNSLNQVLDFLTLEEDVYSDLKLRDFLDKTILFLKFNILNSSDYFQWLCDGGFNLSFSENKKPLLHFSGSDLILLNNHDTISISNVNGHYDMFNNIFNANSGSCSVEEGDFFIDFEFHNFSLDLKKKFFQIDSAYLTSHGPFYGNCLGVYKNKLSSSNSYPSFKSFDTDHSFEVFEGMQILGGLEFKGEVAYFTNSGGSVRFLFNDDQSDYLFSSSHFQLSNNKIFSAESEFSITNHNGAISHPFVKLLYNDSDKRIVIERLNGKRGLSPIRNNFHGLNMFVDRIEIDLVYDHGLFFNYGLGRDFRVLFESNNYFDKNRYEDLLKFDLNPLVLLLDFVGDRSIEHKYLITDFSKFSRLGFSDALNIILDLEIFGMVDYNKFDNYFIIKPWAFNFMNANKGEYDYDSFKIETIAGIGDTIAQIDFILNEMDIFSVNKISITNRFNFSISPQLNHLKFIGDKNFLLDGDIYIGNFAFSGTDILFNYDDFTFSFGKKSVLSFFKEGQDYISSSLIHFDDAILVVDTLGNKSGVSILNDFPKFKLFNSGYLTYLNDPVSFSVDPFELNYLNDLSLKNLIFSGNLYLDGLISDLEGDLFFDKFADLGTVITTQQIVSLYKNQVLFNGVLSLTAKGLFGSGDFNSDYLIFNSDSIQLKSGNIVGFANSINNGKKLSRTSFLSNDVDVSYFPYDNKFLIKSLSGQIDLYSKFDFFGDLYFDGDNLNGSGKFQSDYYSINSSHHYFSDQDIMSADASLLIYSQPSSSVLLSSVGVSVEKNLFSDSVFVSKSNNDFVLPLLDYSLDFDSFIFDSYSGSIYFQNDHLGEEGLLYSKKYGRKGFSYNALEAVYLLKKNQLCVNSVYPLSFKKFLLQPNENSFCVLKNGDFPVFKKATLIKERWLFKDKLYNNKEVSVKPSLKLTILND